MNAARAVACAWLLGAAAAASGADKACTKADAAAAEKAIERVVNWDPLHKAWVDYRHCDTGKAAEGFTDAVLRLVIGNWKTVEGLSGRWHQDEKYREFINGRLRSKEADGDREDIYALAKASCPKGQDAFCKELAEVVMEPAAAKPAPAPATPAAPAAPK